MKKIFSILAICLAFMVTGFAQGDQDDAPIYKVIKTDYCNDNAGTLTGFEVVQVFRIGDLAPVQTYFLDETGAPLVTAPTGGKTSIGACSAPVEFYDYEAQIYCDAGVQYYELLKIARDGAGVETYSVINLNKSGAIYTPSGNEVAGICDVNLVEAESVVTRVTSTTTGTIAANGFVKISIYNVGLADGTVTVGTGTAPLKPGENYQFEVWQHPINGEWMLNNLTGYDATGTEFRVITTAK